MPSVEINIRSDPIADIGHQHGQRKLAANNLTSLLILEIVPFLDEALAVF